MISCERCMTTILLLQAACMLTKYIQAIHYPVQAEKLAHIFFMVGFVATNAI